MSFRYAETLELDQRHPLVRTLSLPSQTLQSHNIEVLIQPASAPSHGNKVGAGMYLIPGLEAPSSATGRFSTITYPVHKALILAPDMDGIQSLLPSESPNETAIGEDMVTTVVDTPWSSLSAGGQTVHQVNPINLNRAEEAIETFRRSLDNSFSYEHTWFQSGLPKISAWLLDGTEALPAIVKPTNRRLIETLTANIEEAIEKEEAAKNEKQASTIVPTFTRDILNARITKWAEDAHTELRDKLDLAFSSKNWRKLAWWKLPWRVDDVTYITSDILRQSWLVDADRTILYLAGRIEQAGLLPGNSVNAATNPDTYHHHPYNNNDTPTPNQQPTPEAMFSTPPPTIPFASLIPLPPPPTPKTHPLSLPSNPRYPIPSIAHTRAYLLHTSIPPLQSLAQRLLLHFLSTTFLTSSLSTLLYISISTTSVYEAGGIAALGAVYGMRRLQRKWEGERERWVGMCREEGRRVLKRVEEGWREAVWEGGMGVKEDEGEKEGRERARGCVGGVRRVLGEMEGVGK